MKKNSIQLNALVIAEIPAPYRVDIFMEMSKWINMDVFFQSNKDQSRSPDYFVKSEKLSFQILDNEIGKSSFKNALKNIKQYDMVIAYHPVCQAALQAEFWCHIKRIPYFVNIDGAFVNPNIARDFIKRVVYRGAVGCFSGGKSATKYFLHYGVKKEKIYEYGFTCLHPEEIASGVVSNEDKTKYRDSLNLLNKKTVIAVGQFIYRKGFDVLLESWSKIKDQNSQLILIGGGPERVNYERYIETFGFKNVMIIDFLPKEELRKYYLASDLFVLPTREDVWGLVVNEAMAIGLPVITTNMCNAGTQLIEDGKNGYVVPVGDANSLAERITDLLSSEKLIEIGKNNIEKIRNYTIENAAISHMNGICSVVNN